MTQSSDLATAQSQLRDDLPWLEGTILAAMRTWVLGCKRGLPTDGPIQTMFANLRAAEATTHLASFMRTLSTGCTRMINIYCTCEPVLSADEITLLDVFAMTQQERYEDATDLLQRFAAPTAAYAASGDAQAIVQLLNDAGHVIGRGAAVQRRHARDDDGPLAQVNTPRRLH